MFDGCCLLPRSLRNGFSWPQVGPEMGPRGSQEAPQTPSQARKKRMIKHTDLIIRSAGPEMDPRVSKRHREGPSWPKDGPPDASKRLQVGPSWPQDSPSWPQEGDKKRTNRRMIKRLSAFNHTPPGALLGLSWGSRGALLRLSWGSPGVPEGAT